MTVATILTSVERLSGGALPPFSCGAPVQDHFLASSARSGQAGGLSATHLAWSEGAIAGFVALSMSTVRLERHERPPEATVSQLPALLIAQLAVNASFRGHGLGEWLLRFAVGVGQGLQRQVGCRYVAIDCSEKLVGYYARHGFTESKGERRRRKEEAKRLAAPTAQSFRLHSSVAPASLYPP